MQVGTDDTDTGDLSLNEQRKEQLGRELFRDLQRIRGIMAGAAALQRSASSWTDPDDDDPVLHLIREGAELLELLIYPENDDGSMVRVESNQEGASHV